MRNSALILASLLLSASAHADLGVGDKAPALKVDTYIQGKQVDLSKGLHVVEFWATWCGPCKMSIPHLTEMAKKYKGKADFTGVSVWENGTDQLGQVKKFVKSMGPKMAYNVAWDGDAKFMTDNWMKAANQDGIPAAFLVKDGSILWIGHPMVNLDETIGQVLKGKFDIEEAKKAAANAKAEQEARRAKNAQIQAKLKPYSDAAAKGDVDAALAALDALKPDADLNKVSLDYLRLQVLLKADDPRGYALAKELSDGAFAQNPQMLNSLAWGMVDPKSTLKHADYDVALYIAKKAVDATKSAEPAVLDTYAVALFRKGDKAKAIATEKQAIRLAQKSEDEKSLVPELQQRIAWFGK